MKAFIISLLMLPLAIVGCSQETQPIEYGKDNCHFCQMRIMDPKFGSEAITDKGRTYKFDSGECLLRYLNKADGKHSHLVVTDFESPETFLQAESAWFLVSDKMPSPMGGNLNAFKNKERAEFFQTKNGGEVFDWNQIKDKYTK